MVFTSGCLSDLQIERPLPLWAPLNITWKTEEASAELVVCGLDVGKRVGKGKGQIFTWHHVVSRTSRCACTTHISQTEKRRHSLCYSVSSRAGPLLESKSLLPQHEPRLLTARLSATDTEIIWMDNGEILRKVLLHLLILLFFHSLGGWWFNPSWLACQSIFRQEIKTLTPPNDAEIISGWMVINAGCARLRFVSLTALRVAMKTGKAPY